MVVNGAPTAEGIAGYTDVEIAVAVPAAAGYTGTGLEYRRAERRHRTLHGCGEVCRTFRICE